MNRLKSSKTYLIGGMDDFSDRGMGWRQEITPFLTNMGIGVLDPTNKHSMIGHEDFDHLETRKKIIEGIESGVIIENDLYTQYNKIMKEVVSIDLRMVDTADFLIVYIDTSKHLCGSYHELAMSVNQRKPTLVVCKQGKIKTPPWIMGIVPHQMIFSTWEQLKKYLIDIDTSENINTLGRWKFFDYDKIFNPDNKNNL